MPDRLADLIHHITSLCSPDQLGRTKIAKIVWLSDVEYFRMNGTTISGSDDYVKDEYGPRHRGLYGAVEKLRADGKVVESPRPTPLGIRRELIPLTTPDVSKFTADEIAVVDRIATFISKMSAKDASDLTHDDLWKAAYLFERIPVAAAAPVEGDVTPEIIAWAASTFNEHSAAS